jgi:hypothetical protein
MSAKEIRALKIVHETRTRELSATLPGAKKILIMPKNVYYYY